ncbi:hypothetical protein MGR01S_30620 [Meiothermus granaticius NBRC 107808]|nr:hypothetical protein MGR01S_30620 [Meiothermus granaticius NBRC 107808]
MRRPVLVVGFQWQTLERFDLPGLVDIADGLVDPGRAEFHLVYGSKRGSSRFLKLAVVRRFGSVLGISRMRLARAVLTTCNLDHFQGQKAA